MTRLESMACILALALAACSAQRAQTGPATAPEEGLLPLADGVWTHTSYHELPGYGLVASNGLVIATPGGAVLVDTAWDARQTRALVDRVRAEIGPIVAVIVTHFHDDRSAGLPLLHAQGVHSYGSRRTAEHMQAQGRAPPQNLFSSHLSLESLGIDGEVFFPGRGHTDDNAVVWLGATRILFGGCVVKSADAQDLGNTADADLAAWPLTIEVLWARYAKVQTIVPGHGQPGSRLLLAHTRALLKHD